MLIFRLNLRNRAIRVLALGLAAVCCGLLARTIAVEFITETLANARLAVAPETLRRAAEFLPHSGRIFARLAQIEMDGGADDLARAETNAAAAVERSPHDYRNYLLLASIEELRGKRTSAERTLNEALRLAPNYSDAHWRLANLQTRAGKLERALPHFQRAIELNPSLAGATIDLIWNATGGANIAALRGVVANRPPEQISLARFLIKRDRVAEAAEILAAVTPKTALESWETKPLIYELIAKNRARLARRLWSDWREPLDSSERGKLIWSGDFESDHLENFEHFQWHLTNNNFARISVDDRESRSGANALLLDFLGRDTTRLDAEVKQQIAVRAGGTYQFEFFVKTEDFHAPEKPRVAVSDPSGKWIVYSPPITGDDDEEWRRVSFVFTAPQKTSGEVALLVTIKITPDAVREDPTRGRIWFDDFAVYERGGK